MAKCFKCNGTGKVMCEDDYYVSCSTCWGKGSLKHNPKCSCPSCKAGGCYIATAVYGDYDAPEVLVLRKFRDDVLFKTSTGKASINFYYWLSPKILKYFGKVALFKMIVKFLLDFIVNFLEKRSK